MFTDVSKPANQLSDSDVRKALSELFTLQSLCGTSLRWLVDQFTLNWPVLNGSKFLHIELWKVQYGPFMFNRNSNPQQNKFMGNCLKMLLLLSNSVFIALTCTSALHFLPFKQYLHFWWTSTNVVRTVITLQLFFCVKFHVVLIVLLGVS